MTVYSIYALFDFKWSKLVFGEQGDSYSPTYNMTLEKVTYCKNLIEPP